MGFFTSNKGDDAGERKKVVRPVISGLTEQNAARMARHSQPMRPAWHPVPTPAPKPQMARQPLTDHAAQREARMAEVRKLRQRSQQTSARISAVLERIRQGDKDEHAAAVPQLLTPQLQLELRSWARPGLVVIGSSTGGPEALTQVLCHLTPPLPPILIVQHIPAMFSRLLAERLDGASQLHVREAATGNDLQPNHVYIAPGKQHMELERMAGQLRLNCHPGPKVNSVCPSVDVLFDSVARLMGDKALGVILTGMGRDGADGLLRMRQAGAHTLGQDEASSVVYGMPRAAFECHAVEHQITLEDMAQAIICAART